LGALLAKPSLSLSPWVRRYALRSAQVPQGWIHFPLPARSDCFLEFYLRDRYQILMLDTGAMHESPGAVIVGPHTQRLEDLVYTGNLLVFSIEFTPVGLRALTGLSPKEIANTAVPASEIFGSAIGLLHERLVGCGDTMSSMVHAAEVFLLERVAAKACRPEIQVVSSIAQTLQRLGGIADVSSLAQQHGKSLRQVERQFLDQVGVGPKAFAKLQRLDRVLRLRKQAPELSWADIAAACGYFDQAHLGRDFRLMTGETPARFVSMLADGQNVWQRIDQPLSRMSHFSYPVQVPSP
jgi:AraC-like DNA-binding protein